ncbi:nucleoside hydrolase-like domain-containing protein [Flavilitoribacter nigricans]|uniref:Uncharacterized protein n=1 Tax=Flavilitoribacter nigricans (strain ATCC 23147 / DSM 23189 / NBRC 102662 / NCIMB 1420 / SS-2) TaxID=1122177 RepID=A0A2D0N1K9_FLAN2|nr:nucleoside hydrolase-like domain-containing protein [Flavilitoribacter nigricans]PHN02432.1 hypothetical protein CRP01_32130 [Flavilitoribacter nigricans DSM 23189 = NBRC 102662]
MSASLLIRLCLLAFIFFPACTPADNPTSETPKPRILISSDIGGTDPDDQQSMIHLLMYADRVQLEGLVASPYGPGRKEHFLEMIDLYDQDRERLLVHAPDLPATDSLRDIVKQGAIDGAPFAGYASPTEGSEWMITCARRSDDRPLWVLVWGGLEDLAQALHDAPDIKENIRVYWIGGPNKKWSVNAYAYIAKQHPDLWMIEANATYRGWFMYEDCPEDLTNEGFYSHHIRERGALGRAFKNYYDGNIKMGDTPSLAYVLDGDPDDPTGESWGGSFVPIDHSSRKIFNRNSTVSDTVAAYAVIEWSFPGPELEIAPDSACFTLEISGQIWPGYYLGDGIYGVRYASKKPEICTYITSSEIPELDGLKGQFVSITPWPGKNGPDDYQLGSNWYSDRPDPDLFLEEQQGVKTVSRHRRSFLQDWANRWSWLD